MSDEIFTSEAQPGRRYKLHANGRGEVEYRLYSGMNKHGKTMTLFAYNKKEAKDMMKKKGFTPIKIFQT